ncbi:MAG: efflux RND transporter periplasmic adaptor subunit [Bacteroidota bacterium]
MKNIAIIAIALLLFGCKSDNTAEMNKLTVAPTAPNVIPVTVTTVETISNPVIIHTSGLVKTNSTTKYAFKIGGIIDKLFVDEGDRINKGQLLATLRMDEIEAQFQQANLSLEKAKRDYDRISYLYKDSIATLEDFQNVKTQLDVAARFLEQIKFNKDFAKIRATNNGFVIAKLSNPGEVIGPGTPALITNDATKSKGYILECTVNDRQWAQVKVGDDCTIHLDAYPDQNIRGRITSKSVQADPVSGAFRVEVSLSNSKSQLATGMYGKAEITTDTETSNIAIAYAALVEANGKDGYVYVPAENDKVARVKIQIDKIKKDKVLISSGLAQGQKVVIGNSAFLSPQSTIKIIE